MKRFGDLFSQITNFQNLLNAALKARKGKRYQKSVASFYLDLESQLFRLSTFLQNKTYQPGGYRTFNVYDPKERMISASPFRDRVVHHALCQVIDPIFERAFIFDSYANRKGKGTHRAIDRYQQFARKYPYVLKCDIRKFFPSIDHLILKRELRRKIKCKDTLWLIDTIIDNSNPQEQHLQWFPGDGLFTPIERRRGLPIGNLTSQFWGNVYLNRMDHWIKEVLQVPAYIRYVDDFVLLGHDKEEIWRWKNALDQYLADYRLLMHPNKTQIHRTENGIPFLGFMIFPHFKYVRKAKIKRYRRYLKSNLKKRKDGLLSPQQLEDQLNAWLGHIRFGQSKRLENSIFNYLRSTGVELHRWPRGSWRVLEQQ